MAMATQLDILLPEAEAHDALHYWADSVGESRGEIFTKTAVVEFILDLTGWRIGEDLLNKRLLEPSCGSGDFVVPAVRRLLADSPGASAGELLPCIRAVEVNQVAFDPGEYYPHHNLYYLTSAIWDLRALQAVLRSNLANAFVATYSLRMRGDCLRFQAQYLRRIRIPQWSDVSEALREALKSAAVSNDQEAIDQTVRELYGLDPTAWLALTTD
jgi:hypothetical protein